MSEIAIAAFKDFQDGDYRVFAVDDFEMRCRDFYE